MGYTSDYNTEFTHLIPKSVNIIILKLLPQFIAFSLFSFEIKCKTNQFKLLMIIFSSDGTAACNKWGKLNMGTFTSGPKSNEKWIKET